MTNETEVITEVEAEAPAADAVAETSTTEAVASTEAEVTTPVADVVATSDAKPESSENAVSDTIVETPAAETPIAETPITEVAAPAAEATPASAPQSSEASDDGSGSGRVVRTLAVGQEVTGTIKRTSEFGAFVDIGVGRDGLVHVSELSTRRVAKVTDVLKEGQEATFWIKELDRERNRISLTMIEPGTKTVRTMQKGDIVTGKVTRIMPYGAFIDIGIGRDALLHVREMGERFVPKPEDVVTLGEEIEARIIEIERRRARVDLSVKGLRPEPEPEMPEVTEQSGANGASGASGKVEEEAELVDKFADLPVMSAIEAAFKKAMGEQSAKERDEKARKNASSASAKARVLQEEMLNRTLKVSN